MTKATIPKGARFFAADLHLHTPASHDYEDKKASQADWVSAAVAKGLDAVAVTDHNSAEWVDLIRNAARKSALVVFPGVEVSTPHCHILAIFDVNTPKSHIDDFLTTVGITAANRGKKEVNSKPLEDVLHEIEGFGGLAVAAHANSSNGLLQQGTGVYRIKMCKDPLIAALEFTKQQHVDDFRNGKVAQYPAKACVQGSDSHSLKTIGERRTFLKMDTPSLWGLKQACEDHEVRIRYSWNVVTAQHPYIMGLDADQGFFSSSPFEFHPSLNCVVGGRGTGKSTALELLRFCFDDVSSIEEIADDNRAKLSALLGEGGVVTVKYFDSDGATKTVTREFLEDDETARSVKNENGSDAELITPPAFFSQGELTRIAAEPMAQLDLIDRYLDVEAEHAEETRLTRELRANGAQLSKLRDQASAADSDVTDKDVGLTATKKKYKDLEKTLADPVFREFPLWESENRYLDVALSELAVVEKEVVDFFDELDLNNRVNPPDATSPNRTLLEDVPAVFDRVALDVASQKTKVITALKTREAELEGVKKKWLPKFEAKKTSYEAAISKVGTDDVKKAQAQLRSLKRRLDELEQKSKGQLATLKHLDSLEETRATLRKALVKCRKSRFQKRAAKAVDWNTRFSGLIQVKIDPGADHSAYIDSLRSLSKGAMLRDPDLVSIAVACSPERVRSLIEAGDTATLASEAGIKPENARKLVESGASKPGTELLDLEAVALPDVPDIRYQAQTGSVRGLAQLSVGQKATVIISLALVEGDSPLVIDQPEEPLDTLAITTPVVQTLRGQKENRQFIFTTHNANVAVGADAELNIVLEAGADKGSIRAAGGVDHADTNKLLVLHLEGGPEAITRRVKKYRPL